MSTGHSIFYRFRFRMRRHGQEFVVLATGGRFRPLLLMGVIVLVVTQMVALSPAQLEENPSAPALIEPEALLHEESDTVATGIPKGKIPEYSVDQFDYVSTVESVKQWHLIAERAFLFNENKLVHARQVKAFLFDPDGKTTVVTGKEAKYFMNQRDLEIFGEVHAVFPDGFELTSEYLRYQPNERKIEIPVQYIVNGGGKQSDGQVIRFQSMGLDFAMARSKIVLPKDVQFSLARSQPGSAVSAAREHAPAPAKGKEEVTTIQSDHCVIERDKQLAHFTMFATRPLDTRFVRISQPTMISRSRRADLNYGDYTKILQYMTAHEDVLIKEVAETDDRLANSKPRKKQNSREDGREAAEQHSLRYATSSRADFDSRRDIIVLSGFPQVYQDNDTVTGDVILLHRDTDIVEVENSNAFSQGN